MATTDTLVMVTLDDLNSMLDSAISRALRNGGVYERAGMICPDAIARLYASLGASGCLVRNPNNSRDGR